MMLWLRKNVSEIRTVVIIVGITLVVACAVSALAVWGSKADSYNKVFNVCIERSSVIDKAAVLQCKAAAEQAVD